MARYSKSFENALLGKNIRPHIFIDSKKELDYISTWQQSGFSSRLNSKADIFCQKLNSANDKVKV